jgi:hypothetical protein
LDFLTGFAMATGRSTSVSRGRERARKTDRKRAPLAGSLPKDSKRERGRAEEAPSVPANIRAFGVEVDPGNRAYIRRKLGMKLGKFAPSIERVSVRIEDVNGPRGGVDHACRVKVVLSDLPSVVVEERDAAKGVVVDRALAAVERAVRRTLQRRRVRSTSARRGTREPRQA